MAAVLFCFYGFHIGGIYGFSIFPDEFAYWSYAAGMSGYDWSGITSLGSYYSYGYSLVLFPIFVFCKNAVTAYRIAVGCNFFFLFLAFCFLTGTMKKLIPEKNNPVVLLSGLAVLFPGNLFYAQMTMTEALLCSLYILTGSILCFYLESNRLSALLMLMLALMYLYIVHMRTVGIVISGILVLALHMLAGQGKKRHIPVVIAAAAALFALSGIGKNLAAAGMFGGIHRELAAGNDYAGQMEKLRYILTPAGFYDFLVGISGKILYLGLATYGLFYWGIYALMKQAGRMLRNIRHHAAVTRGELFAAFLLLSVITQILIASVYLLTLGEVDDYTYGRYNEFLLPFVMVFGAFLLWKMRTRTVWSVTAVLALLQLIVTVGVVRQIVNTETDIFYGYFMVGIGYWHRGEGFDAVRFYAEAYLFGELLTVCVTGLLLFIKSGRKKEYLLFILMVAELLLAMRADSIYLQPFKKAAFRDSRLAEKIVGLQGGCPENGAGNADVCDRAVIYVEGNTRPYIGILQFMLRDTKIRIVERDNFTVKDGENIKGGELLLLSFDDELVGELAGQYDHEDIYGHFALFYNDQ